MAELSSRLLRAARHLDALEYHFYELGHWPEAYAVRAARAILAGDWDAQP